MAHRAVKNVEWARPISRPSCIPEQKRRRGTKGLGLSYEKKLGKALLRANSSCVAGQWFEYFADGKRGYCQTDFLLFSGLEVYILECKLTNVEEALGQLRELYAPVVQAAYRLPVHGIVVVKSLSRASGALIVATLKSACSQAIHTIPVLHYLGQGPL